MTFERLKVSVGIALFFFTLIIVNIISFGFLQNISEDHASTVTLQKSILSDNAAIIDNRKDNKQTAPMSDKQEQGTATTTSKPATTTGASQGTVRQVISPVKHKIRRTRAS